MHKKSWMATVFMGLALPVQAQNLSEPTDTPQSLATETMYNNTTNQTVTRSNSHFDTETIYRDDLFQQIFITDSQAIHIVVGQINKTLDTPLSTQFMALMQSMHNVEIDDVQQNGHQCERITGTNSDMQIYSYFCKTIPLEAKHLLQAQPTAPKPSWKHSQQGLY